MEKKIQRDKELALLQTPLLAPSDDEEYEEFYKKNIEPIVEERYRKKKRALKNYCKKKNKKVPHYRIDVFEDKIELLSDDSDKDEIEHLGMGVYSALEDSEIGTFQKGRQIALFAFEGTASHLGDFPMAIEGDIIIKQSFELTGGEWEDLEYFSKHPNNSLITCSKLPKNLTGNFIVVYGKYFSDFSRSSSLRSSKVLHESMENITTDLKEIDRKEKEQEFIKTNKTNFQKNTTKGTRYRVPSAALKK